MDLMEFEEKIDTEVLYGQDTNEFDKFCVGDGEVVVFIDPDDEEDQTRSYPVEGSKRFDLHLISSIKKYPNTYAADPRKKKAEIEQDWQRVADECNSTVDRVKYRWKLLRGYFSAEKKKRKLEVKINAANLFTRPHFALYDDMLFLDQYVKPRRSFKRCQNLIGFEEKEEKFASETSNSQIYGSDDNSEDADIMNPELIDLDNLLIEHVKKYRYLYDKSNTNGQKNDLHDHTWAKIAKACGVTEKYAKDRWYRLRSYYVRARKRKGLNGNNTFFFFDSMQFLDEFIQFRRNFCSRKSVGNENYDMFKNNLNEQDESNENYETWSKNVLVLDKSIIDAVKSFPHLYDHNDSNHGSSLKMAEAWFQVSQICGQPEGFVKTRWGRLRGYYVKELRKTEANGKSTKMPKRIFPFFEDMKFLQTHVKKRKVFSTADQSTPKKAKLDSTICSDLRAVRIHRISGHPNPHTESQLESNVESENNSELSELENEDTDLDLLLIELVRRNPHLYNKSKRTPEQMVKINSTWSEIAKKCDVEEDYAKTRWSNLRKYYSAENRRLKLNDNGGQSTRKFPFFEIMNFLDGFVEIRRSHKDYETKATDASEQQLIEVVHSTNIKHEELEVLDETQEAFDRNLIECISYYPNIWKQNKGNKDSVPDYTWVEVGLKCGISAEMAKNRWDFLKKHANDVDDDNCDSFLNSKSLNETFSEIENSEMTVGESIEIEAEVDFGLDSDQILIRAVRGQPCLYTGSKKTSEEEKDEAWKEVAKECSATVEKVKNRWTRLRAYYAAWKKRRELKQNHLYKRNFPFWEDMKFLDQFIKKRNRKGLFKKHNAVSANSSILPDLKNEIADEEIEYSNGESCSDFVLIDLVQKHRVLYDFNHQYYGNAEKTRETWERIGNIYSVPGNEVKERWRCLRKYFVKSLKKGAVLPDSAEKRKNLEKMSFLKEFVKRRSFFGRSGHSQQECLENGPQFSDPIYEDQGREKDEADRFLIDCVRRRPALYDRKHKLFGDEETRNEAWDSISRECGKSAHECQKRWILLRRYFSYEKRKIENNNPGEVRVPRRTFPFYEDMYFLNSFVMARKNLRKLTLEDSAENFEEYELAPAETSPSADSSYQNENSQQSEATSEAVLSQGNSNPESDIQIIFIYNNKDEQFCPLEITKINKSNESLSEFLMFSNESNQ